MAINFSGEFATPRTPDEVFDFLSDPNKFAPLLPDFQSMSMEDPTHFTVKVKVGVGNIRGNAEIKMELVEAVKPRRAHYQGQGTAVGSQVTVSAGFDLHPNGESTRVLWQGETSIFGKLASMAGGMLEPLGRKNIQKLIDGLQQALSQPLTQVETLSEPPVAEATISDPSLTTKGEAAEPDPGNPDSTRTATSMPLEAPGLSPANSNALNDGTSSPAQETNGDYPA